MIRFFRPLIAWASLCMLFACTAVQYPAAPKLAISNHSMAVTAHPEATAAANAVLARGGNAADAAVASGFVIAVVEQTMNSIGGRNQILVRTPSGEYQAYNGMTEVPSGYLAPEAAPANGYGVIATPGVVAALARLHSDHGSLLWADLLAPAIRLASEGFTLLPGEASRHASALDDIQGNAGFQRAILDENRQARKAGETLRQPQLANTLSTLATEGADSFYTGSIARRIVADMEANGGHVRTVDLANYQALDGRYVSIPYRGYEIHSIAAPAGGGLVSKTLNLLENFDLSELNDWQWAGLVNQALAIAIESMNDDYFEHDLERLTSKTWAAEQSRRMSVPQLAGQPGIAQMSALAQAGERPRDTDWTGDSWGPNSHHTTHFVTADCAGAVVSITQTNGPNFGSKVISPDLGFVYASTMGSYLSSSQQGPGSRPRTTIAPTIVTLDGEVQLVLGAAGGLRILSAVVQTISRYVDQGMSLEDAVAAPRVHPMTDIDPQTRQRSVRLRGFHAEATANNGWSARQLAAFEQAGMEVEPSGRYGAFGRVHALEKTADGWLGAADLDWEGSAQGTSAESCMLR